MPEYVRQYVYRNQEAGRLPAHSLPLEPEDDAELQRKASLHSLEELQEGVEKAVTWK